MPPEFSFISCINDHNAYERFVVKSLSSANSKIELIPISNVDGQHSAASALNLGYRQSKGEVLVFCHQDIEFQSDWTRKVADAIEILERRKSKWGILGLMGVRRNGLYAGCILDPHTRSRFGALPTKVQSVDEVCIIAKRSNFLPFDEELGGFHLYGADISLEYHSKGYETYAIDAPAIHHSGGSINQSFDIAAKKLTLKWNSRKSPLFIETTCGVFPLNESPFTRLLCKTLKFRRGLLRRTQGRHKTQ